MFCVAGYTRAFSALCAMNRIAKGNAFGKEAVKSGVLLMKKASLRG
jgi:hypothetical protein